MRRRKKLAAPGRQIPQPLGPNSHCQQKHDAIMSALSLTSLLLLIITSSHLTECMLLLTTNCLSASPGCSCSWRSGKFVANCSGQSLEEVPKNDYYDYLLANAGNNQMPTLNRDIQQLNLAFNKIASLKGAEFYMKKFRNLQKIYLNSNKLLRIDSSAFYKLTGLVELDLSENSIFDLSELVGEDENPGAWPLEASQLNGTGTTGQASSLGGGENDEQMEQAESSSSSGSGAAGGHLGPSGASAEPKRPHLPAGTAAGAAITSAAASSTLHWPGSFLNHLGQLRQLNLASNQLSRLERYIFSPLSELRQLYLSRNKISYIDKRAFEGLKVLNILHLDGNKLSHLDGAALRQLPKLYALQLAGSTNEWRCDCRLRKLVRLLKLGTRPPGAATAEPVASGGGAGQSAPSAANILQDEPKCATAASPAEKENNQDEPKETAAIGARAWTNMTLHEFQCAPEAAVGLMPATLASSEPLNLDAGDRWTSTGGGAQKTKRWLVRQHYLAGEPMELTCALALTDELDLDLVQLEWWQLEAGKRPELLWRSAGANRTTSATSGAEDESARSSAWTRPAGCAIIDYVTRANGSSGEPANEAEPRGRQGELELYRVLHLIVEPSAHKGDQEERQEEEEGASRKEAHERQFLCRVTNGLGRLEVEYSLAIDSTSREARREWRRRQAMRKRLARAQSGTGGGGGAQWLSAALAAWAGAAPGGPVSGAKGAAAARRRWAAIERAKAQLAEWTLAGSSGATGSAKEGPLFAPLSLPEELAAVIVRPRGANVEPSQGRAASQPAARHANGSNSLQPAASALDGASRTGNRQLLPGAGAQLARRSLNSIALELIGRYTSNLDSLIEPRTGTRPPPGAPAVRQGGNSNDDDDGGGDDGARHRDDHDDDDYDNDESHRRVADGQLTAHSAAGLWDRWADEGRENWIHGQANPSGQEQQRGQGQGQLSKQAARLRAASRLFYARYLDRWVQMAIGEAPLLLAVCAGLLAGCLFTVLIILRLRCERARVADSCWSRLSGASSASMAARWQDEKQLSSEQNGAMKGIKSKKDGSRHSPPPPNSGAGGLSAAPVAPSGDEQSDEQAAGTQGGSSSSGNTVNSQQKLITVTPSSMSSSSDESNGKILLAVRQNRTTNVPTCESGQLQQLGSHGRCVVATRPAVAGYRQVGTCSPCQSDELNGETGGQPLTAHLLERQPAEWNESSLCRGINNKNKKLRANMVSFKRDNSQSPLPLSASRLDGFLLGDAETPGGYLAQQSRRLIVVTPQPELMVSSDYYDRLQQTSTHVCAADQLGQATNSSSPFVTYQLDGCQQLDFPAQVPFELTREPADNWAHTARPLVAYEESNTNTTTTATNEDSSSSLVLTGSQFHHLQPSGYVLDKRTNGFSSMDFDGPAAFLVSPYTNSNNNINQHGQMFANPQHKRTDQSMVNKRHQMTLPARKFKHGPCRTEHMDSPTSSTSPVASISSSLASSNRQPNQQVASSGQLLDATTSNTFCLEDALKLLRSSVDHCL